MFTDMGVEVDAPLLDGEFRAWLREMMPAGTYRAWVVEDKSRSIVAGGGVSVLPWPPGPRYMGTRIGVVYNVYTEPAHRRAGLARRLMEAIHGWCREAGVASMALNASDDGRPLYEKLGYQVTASPMMFFAVPSDQ